MTQRVCEDIVCASYNLIVGDEHNHKYLHPDYNEPVLIVDQNETKQGSEGSNSYRIPIAYRFDLIPPVVLQQLAAIYEEGAQKYGEAKYIESPLPASVIVNHMLNHLLLACSGDVSEEHWAKVMWGAATMIVMKELHKDGVLNVENDLSKYGAKFNEAIRKRRLGV